MGMRGRPSAPWDGMHSGGIPRSCTRPGGKRIIKGCGASGDKGRVMVFIGACRAWKAVNGSLPIPVTILLEGQEESGSMNLLRFSAALQRTGGVGLAADVGASPYPFAMIVALAASSASWRRSPRR